ncbi:MAG TPA: ion transporter [Sulfurospirillum arcachonense]|nr:ion transporter [Sulfurospirillum arcachonense]HIP44357.1 ion transporter [Sulfurospirillum arcachonense]
MNNFVIKVKKVRDSTWFSNLTTSIIIFYASVLGFETIDSVAKPFGSFFYILDYAITVYFVIELTIKMLAEDKFTNFFKNGWNLFDFFIVMVTLVPLENSSFAAIARLLRIFRVLRLFTARPELKSIIDMLMKAIPAIIDIVILLFIIFYIYAIIGSVVFADMPSGLWDNFLIAMLTLFRIFTFEDWTDVMYETMEVYPWSWIYYISFIIIAAFVFFNLFVAVIIGEMQKMQDEKMKEEIHEDSKKLDTLLEEIRELREIVEKQKSG